MLAARIQLGERETDSVFVSGIADTGDAESHEFIKARVGASQQFGVRLLQIRGALVDVQLASFEKQMSVRLDESRQQGCIRRMVIRLGLSPAKVVARRCLTVDANKQNLFTRIDDVGIVQRPRAYAVKQRSHVQPNRTISRG